MILGGIENNGKSKLTTQLFFHLLFGSKSAFVGALYCELNFLQSSLHGSEIAWATRGTWREIWGRGKVAHLIYAQKVRAEAHCYLSADLP